MTAPRRRNVFDWLDHIRARPGMYLRDGTSLSDLETLVWGYHSALSLHGIDEGVPSMGHHFRSWLRYRKRWSCSRGWAYAIGSRHSDGKAALAAFFRLIDEYRLLRPLRLCSVQLGPEHAPTGRRRVYGMDARMEKPQQVDVLRYGPEPLHFLRFHYPDRLEDDDLLMTGAGEHQTELDDAKRWVLEELQVDLGSWKHLDPATGVMES